MTENFWRSSCQFVSQYLCKMELRGGSAAFLFIPATATSALHFSRFGRCACLDSSGPLYTTTAPPAVGMLVTACAVHSLLLTKRQSQYKRSLCQQDHIYLYPSQINLLVSIRPRHFWWLIRITLSRSPHVHNITNLHSKNPFQESHRGIREKGRFLK